MGVADTAGPFPGQPGSPEASPGTSPPAPRSKRSQTVSLVLVAGAGATALWLGALDPSQREEDVLVYPTPEACAAARIRSEGDCRREHGIAQAAYRTAAPRYATMSECERHHGFGHCTGGEVLGDDSARGKFVPLMSAYLIGRTAEQALEPQPLFDHEPEAGSSGSSSGHGGYCTGAGSRIVTSAGGRSSSARVSSSSVRTASFGGFSGTGRSVASHSASHGGGFGTS